MWKNEKYSVSTSEDLPFLKASSNRIARLTRDLFTQNKNHLYWSVYEPKNFGDWVGPYLFSRYTNRVPVLQPSSRWTSTVFTAGSIFRHIRSSDSAIVWGSGLISRNDHFSKPKEILAVRGRKTRDELLKRGIKCPPIYGDPAILLPDVYQIKKLNPIYSIGIIPHFKELDLAKELYSSISSEIVVIDPTAPIEVVIDSILQCEVTFSSSLHGLIVSHTYGVKSVWCRINPNWDSLIEGDDIKFHDYYSAFGEMEAPECINLSDLSFSDARKLESLIKGSYVPDKSILVDQLRSECPF